MLTRFVVTFALAAAIATLFAPSGAGAAVVPTCHGKKATEWLTSPGTLTSSNNDAVIVGTSGNDTIYAYGWRTTVCGGGGNDYIEIYQDSLGDGGTGNDTVYAYNGAAIGGSGDDYVSGSGVDSTAAGGSGDDWVELNNGATGDGGSGNDTVRAFGTGTVGHGGSGDDRVEAYFGATGDGGSGNDTVGGYYAEQLLGGAGDDVINSQYTNALIDCGSGTADVLTTYDVSTATVRRCEQVSAQ